MAGHDAYVDPMLALHVGEHLLPLGRRARSVEDEIDEEMERVLAMTPEEIDRDLEAHGIDLQAEHAKADAWLERAKRGEALIPTAPAPAPAPTPHDPTLPASRSICSVQRIVWVTDCRHVTAGPSCCRALG